MTRQQFDALWARWDENANGKLEVSELAHHAAEIAHLVGDSELEDPETLEEFLISFYDGRVEGSVLDSEVDREEVWAMLQEAARLA